MVCKLTFMMVITPWALTYWLLATTAFSLALILRSTDGFALTSLTTKPHTNNRLPRALSRPGA